MEDGPEREEMEQKQEWIEETGKESKDTEEETTEKCGKILCRVGGR